VGTTIATIASSPIQLDNNDFPVTVASGGGVITTLPAPGALYTSGSISSGVVTITSLGVLTDSSPDAAGVYLSSGGSIINAGAGLISGYSYGVRMNGATSGYIYNALQSLSPIQSSIVATGAVVGNAIEINGTAKIANRGLISGISDGIIAASSSSTLTIVNADARILASYLGVSLFATAIDAFAGTIVNFAAGTIAAGAYGIDGTNLTVQNGGVIKATRTDSTAIRIAGSGGVTNLGVIYGGGAGIRLTNPTGIIPVINTDGRIAGGQYAIYAGSDGGAASIVNSATIAGTGTASSGIYLRAGGTVTNKTGGTISGDSEGINFEGNVAQTAYVTNASGASIISVGAIVDLAFSGIPVTVVNAGYIAGIATSDTDFGEGIELLSGGDVTNQTGGTIVGDAFGVAISSGGMIVNQAGATILGGVYAQGGVTVYNAGRIGPANPAELPALYVGNFGELQIKPGAEFDGDVTGGPASGISLLAGATAGELNGLGSKYIGLQTVTFDPGAKWTIDAEAASVAKYQFDGMAVDDFLDINGITGQTVAGFASGVLSLANSGGTVDLTLNIAGPFQASSFVVADDGNSRTLLTIGCFVDGTSILTTAGSRPVEALAPGDEVVTVPCGPRRIVWTGQRTIDCRRHPSPETVWPVRVARGAFGPETPLRDLFLSPDHAVFVNGVLVPVKLLIDGAGIVQVKRDLVTYHHVELPEHAVILAEGLTVESYLDTGDRLDFRAEAGVARLYPDVGTRLPPVAAMAWETRGAAPLVLTAGALERARKAVTDNTSRKRRERPEALVRRRTMP
jgi:hypothetical protein